MKRLSGFLRDYNRDDYKINIENDEKDKLHLMDMWHEHLKNVIIELFNNFLYGNLLSATAMTRTLIECYVYISILKKEQSPKLMEDWYLYSFMRKAEENEKLSPKIIEMVKECCKVLERDFSELDCKFKACTKSENSWLCDIIGDKRVTFKKVCAYLGEDKVYDDFQQLCSFVHGQDVQAKMMPFIFYSSIYTKLYLMCTYMFKSIRLFDLDDVMEWKIQSLEWELLELGDQMLK